MAIGIILLLAMGSRSHEKVLDERLTFRKRDKIPYGTFVAYENLKSLFPGASVTSSIKEPGYWDSLSLYDKNQALIIVAPEFNADASEMKTLIRFASNGNDVFISTMNMPYEVNEILRCDVNTTEQLISYFGGGGSNDTLTVALGNPPFTPARYTYPGKQFDGYFSKYDTTTTTILGFDKKAHPDFIHFRAGQGNVYVHLAPMIFTNYFLLHANNLKYYENVISVIPKTTTKIAWDEYFLYKKGNNNKKKDEQKGWLGTLLALKNPDGKLSIAAAFWALVGLLVLFVLMEMRRKQRYIPVVKKPRNDSLDFVKTIGRLYHDKGDHQNLSRKMAAYFLEHVRNRYKIPTGELNEQFVRTLHAKTGIAQEEINGIVSFIHELDHRANVSSSQLISFHNQLESYYKKE
jgi:hypothetical protein